MIENPFFHHGPIRDPACFHNRKKEVKRVLEMLGKGQSVSVIGPRKIGKTSLLLYISQPEVMRQHGLDPIRYLFVYFKCEGLSNLDREALYGLLLQAVLEKASQQGYDFSISGCLDSYISFERALRDILNRKLKLALLFDEFESLGENRNLGNEFFAGLRALTTRFEVAYVTASQRPLLALRHTEECLPFFNIFVPLKLGLFRKAESWELIESSMRKAEATLLQEVTSKVLELGGRHPFFLQVAGHWALELQATKGISLEDKDYHILAQTVRGEVESYFECFWRHLTLREQQVLAALPSTHNEETYREELESLTSFCLIVREDGRYKYFSPLFRDFVRRQRVENLLQVGQLSPKDTSVCTAPWETPAFEHKTVRPLELPYEISKPGSEQQGTGPRGGGIARKTKSTGTWVMNG